MPRVLGIQHPGLAATYGRLEDPFACSNSHPGDAQSTTSAPARACSSLSSHSTPTRISQSLSNTPCSSSLRRLTKPASVVSPTFHRGQRDLVKVVIDGSPTEDHPCRPLSTTPACLGSEPTSAITDDNAQHFYGPEHAVFLGNLPKNMANDVLQTLIKEELESRVGKCYITIARDARSIPTAFVTFSRIEHARKALVIGSELVIGRRPLRAEAPKGSFLLIAFKRDGLEVTHEEIQALFEDKAPHRCFAPDKDMLGTFNLPLNAMCLQFATFGHYRDARKVCQRISNDISIVPLSRLATDHSKHPYSEPECLHPVDLRRVVIDQLPSACTESDLMQLFGVYGKIHEVSIIQPSPADERARSKRCACSHAFLRFSEPWAACEAVAHCAEQKHRGQPLRAEFPAHIRTAIRMLEREARGYIAQCYSQLGHSPPPNMILNHLTSKAADSPGSKFRMLDGVPCSPLVFCVGSLLLFQGQFSP